MADLAPPTGLRKAGKRLWKSITADVGHGWRLDARELHLLERACRVEDELRILEEAVDTSGPMVSGSKGQPVVNPALVEARQLRLVQQRLLGGIELCDPAHGTRSAPSAHASAAAHARWKQAS
jgi:P27 family predicted phage terminase small subunit